MKSEMKKIDALKPDLKRSIHQDLEVSSQLKNLAASYRECARYFGLN